ARASRPAQSLDMRFLCILLLASLATAAELPRPRSDHPGNIFLAGERVVVSVPAPDTSWKLSDYERVTRTMAAEDGKLDLGELPIGYYELRGGDEKDRITVGVIAPLAAPTPPTSPISIDVAMAWFYKTPAQQHAVANVCKLAGINWVRDRLSW